MAKLTLNSTSTGSVSFDAPVTTENTTITVPAANAGMQVMKLETAQNATSGTAIDFTGIPSWVKKITVMFNSVSTNGSSQVQIQLGTLSGVETSGYLGSGNGTAGVSVATISWTNGILTNDSAISSAIRHGMCLICNMGNNAWSISAQFANSDTNRVTVANGSKTLSETLDRIRITTVNGTDTFDAGSVNILYEGY